MGGGCNEESFSDYTVLYGQNSKPAKRKFSLKDSLYFGVCIVKLARSGLVYLGVCIVKLARSGTMNFLYVVWNETSLSANFRIFRNQF